MNESSTPRMSREEMLDTLKGLVFGTFDRTTVKEREALDMAIKALEQEPCERFEWGIDGNVYKIIKAKDGKEICQQVCDDAVSRQDVLKTMCEFCPVYNCTSKCSSYKHITEVPPVRPQEKTGHWIANADGIWIKHYECSECGKRNSTHSDYCPNCGCRMVEP